MSAGILILITGNWNGWVGERTWQSTDDAYVRADLTPLSTKVVGPGTQVISLVQREVWVQANYKETQLRQMHPGDPATIRVDAFPGVLLKGKVDQVAPASGSQFALLPPDNATGNFTKIVQRVPVKIVLDSGQATVARLRPGLSAIARVGANGTGN